MPINTQQLPSETSNDVVMIEEVHRPTRNNESIDITTVPKSSNNRSVSMEIDEILPGTSRSKPNPPSRVLTFHISLEKAIHTISCPEYNTLGNYQLIRYRKTFHLN